MPNESSVLVRLRLLGGQVFRAEATRDAGALGKVGGAATAAGAKLKTAGAAIGGATVLLRRLATPLAIIAGVSVDFAVKFQQAMELVHTQTGASQREVNKLSKQVLNLARTSASQSPVELANALYRLEGAGIRGAKAMTALKAASDLAAVGNANVEDTAKTLAQVWFSGIKGAGNMRKVVAELNATVGAGDLRLQQLVDALGVGIMPVARNVGLRMRDITGALALFGDETNNVSGWTAQLATALHFLYNPTTKAETAFESIGLTGTRMAKDLRKPQGLLTAMRDLRDHLDKLPGGFRGVKASQALGAILPGGRGRVLNVLMGQLDRYQQKLKQVGDTTGRFGDAVQKTHETAAYRIHHAWAQIQADLTMLGTHLLPAAAGAFTLLADGIDLAAQKIEALANSSVGQRIGKIAQNIKTVVSSSVKPPQGGPPVPKGMDPRYARGVGATPARQLSSAQRTGSAVHGVLQNVFAWIGKEAPKAGAAIVSVGAQIVGAFKPAVPFVTNVLWPLLKGIATGVIVSVVAAFKVAIFTIKMLATALGWVGNLLKPFRGIIQGIGFVIGFVFSGPILKALGALGKLGLVFRLMRIPISIANGAFRVVAGTIGRGVGLFIRANTWLGRFAGTFGGVGRRVVLSVTNMVGGVISKIEGLLARLRGFGTRFLNIGKGIMGKLFNGMRSAFSGATGAMAGLGRMLANWMNAHTPLGDEVKAGPIHFRLPRLATGGVVRRGGLAIVGERGPELAALPTGAKVYNARQTREMASVQPAETTLVANLYLSGKQIHQEVFKVNRAMAEAT